ncbi:MAG: AAA family ATPase [Thiohalomonadales bacterium]
MKRIIIFGNSGSGKSTLAMQYASKQNLQHLDLDILAWEDTNPPTRKALKDSAATIKQFIEKNKSWVIEGGYSDLLAVALNNATEIIFLNLDIETCIRNCKKRPWESHKYQSAEKQNENLEMLIEWVKQYPIRKDEFSLESHLHLFNTFYGHKTEYNANDRN